MSIERMLIGIRSADLNRLTVDRLVRVLNRLDSRVQVAVSLRPREHCIEGKMEAAKSVAVCPGSTAASARRSLVQRNRWPRKPESGRPTA